ncbi:MAG: trigger factor [Ilumatobacteraceae bacterium]
MKSTLETLEGNKVKLSVAVDEAEFDHDIDVAFRKIAREVRLPGFRPGKAPRRILEARIGVEAARQQALQDAIPQYLAKAVKEHDVDLIATPQVEVTGGEETGEVEFDATCEIRPVIEIPGYKDLKVELESITASDDELAEAVDAERKKHGSLVDVDRAVQSGDQVTLDLAAERDGEPVAGLNTEGWLYEVGKGWVAEDFDEHLLGASKGQQLNFVSTPSGTSEEASFSVTITNVQTLELPEVTDDWVGEISDQDTVEEWHAAIRERLETAKLNKVRQGLVDRVMTALAELVEIESPAPLVESVTQQRIQNFVRQLNAQGISVEQWFQMTGQDVPTFTEQMREQADKAVKVDLALRAVATAEGIEVGDDEIEAEYQRMAIQANEKVQTVRKAYVQNDLVGELAAEIRKSNALERLLHNVELVDPDGNRLDNDQVLGHGTHDHDHDDHDEDDHGDAEATEGGDDE